jgi:uncharacterized membrane protein YkvI
MALQSNKIIRVITPGLIFQSIVIAGGYGTGAELSQFFFPYGPLGGILSMLVTLVCFSVVSAATYEFVRVFKTFDYRSMFKQLIGPLWVVFEVCILVLLLLVLSVIVAASGANAVEVFGTHKWVGIILLSIGIIALILAGTKTVITVLSFWSYVLYAVYIVFVILCFNRFGGAISEQLTVVKEIKPGWVVGGGQYAFYNLACVPIMLYALTRLETRGEAIASGICAGIIGIIPAFMLFLAMIGFYPGITEAAVPVNVVFKALDIRWFEIIFQIVLFGTFIETGTGFIKAVTDRVEAQFCSEANPRKWLRPVTVIVAMALGIVVSSFGLIGLIAKGYGTITWGFFVVYVIPILTLGIYKVAKRGKTI